MPRNDLLRSTELNFLSIAPSTNRGRAAVLLDLMKTVWLRLGPFMRLATAKLEIATA